MRSQYRRKHVDVRGDGVYASIEHARANIPETTSKLQEDVDRAHAQFKADKAAVDELKGQKAPSLYGLKQCFRIAGNQKGKTPFERMLDDMFAQMMAELMRQMIEEQQRQAREEAEKRLRAANRAIDNEASRTRGRRVTSHMQDAYEADKAAYKTNSEQYE